MTQKIITVEGDFDTKLDLSVTFQPRRIKKSLKAKRKKKKWKKGKKKSKAFIRLQAI